MIRPCSRSRRRRWHIWLVLGLVAYLGVNAWQQYDPSEGGAQGTYVAQLSARLRGVRPLATGRPPQASYSAVIANGKWDVRFNDWSTSLGYYTSGDVVRLAEISDSADVGLWSRVVTRRRFALEVQPGPRAQVDARDLGAMYDALMRSNPSRFTPARKVAELHGGAVEYSPRWGAIANDASVLLAFGALIWRRRTPLALLRRARRRTIGGRKIGCCRACGYDLRALAAPSCPECGAARDAER